MPRRRQFERSPGELGGSGRVARTKIAGRFEQGGDGGFVARLGAVGELLSHLDRYRAFGHEHVGRLAVKRPANRDGGTGPHRLADQVVSERKAIAALHEDASLDKIFDWFQQLRYRHPGQLSQLVYAAMQALCPVVVVREETGVVHGEVVVGIRDPQDADHTLGYAFEEAAVRVRR